jgi:hypothetical protein
MRSTAALLPNASCFNALRIFRPESVVQYSCESRSLEAHNIEAAVRSLWSGDRVVFDVVARSQLTLIPVRILTNKDGIDYGVLVEGWAINNWARPPALEERPRYLAVYPRPEKALECFDLGGYSEPLGASFYCPGSLGVMSLSPAAWTPPDSRSTDHLVRVGFLQSSINLAEVKASNSDAAKRFQDWSRVSGGWKQALVKAAVEEMFDRNASGIFYVEGMRPSLTAHRETFLSVAKMVGLEQDETFKEDLVLRRKNPLPAAVPWDLLSMPGEAPDFRALFPRLHNEDHRPAPGSPRNRHGVV